MIPTDTEKAFDKNQHTFMIKSSHQFRKRGKLPQLDKDHEQNAYSKHPTY